MAGPSEDGVVGTGVFPEKMNDCGFLKKHSSSCS